MLCRGMAERPPRLTARGRRIAWMDAALRDYETTGNPVHAWEAYCLARKARARVPASVLAYLDRVAAGISSLARHTVPRKGQQAQAVYQTLEFKRLGRTGAANPLRAIADQGHRAEVACEVSLTLLTVKKLDLAFDTVVNEHPRRCKDCRTISRRTVSRYYREFFPTTNKQ